MKTLLPVALLLFLPPVRAPAAAPAVTLVACAPGYPGSTAEAQPHMDALADALAKASGWPPGKLSAVYLEKEAAGVARLGERDAALALVPLPFLLEHGAALRLEPRLQVVMKGGEAAESWSLVAKKGRVTGPAALSGFTVISIAGYAPGFVRGALGAWGRIPESAKVFASAAVLSALRKAAAGEDVAVLLDAAQAAALPTLPFAAELEVVAKGPAFPASFLCTVASRVPAKEWKALAAGFAALPADPQGAAALESLRIERFPALDAAGLAAARKAAEAR
jgi:hypothetical protein